MSRFKWPLGDLRRNAAGSVAVMYALALPALMGFAGMGAEVGYWYVSKRSTQSAADAGATAGALELTYGGSNSTISAQALAEAERNGFRTAGGATYVVNHPPLHGAYAGDTTAVEVMLDVPHDTTFASVLSFKKVTIAARAVARQAPGGDACILALSTTAHDAVTNSGGAGLNIDGCIVAANSKQSDAISLGGSSSLLAESMWTSGGIDIGSNATVNIKTTPVEQGFPLTDPYAGTPIPSGTSPCLKAKDIGGTMTVPNSGYGFPTTICSPGSTLHLTSSDDIDFQPGVYLFDSVGLKVDGGATLTCSSCTPGGDGVTFIFTGPSASQVGTVDINGSATVTLNAPSSGTYSGLLFYQDPIAANTASLNSNINGGANIQLTGALYFPHTHVNINGNVTGTSQCTLIVADTITFSGSSTLTTTKCSDYGYKIVTSIRVALVE